MEKGWYVIYEWTLRIKDNLQLKEPHPLPE